MSRAVRESGITSPNPKVVKVVPLTYRYTRKESSCPFGSSNDARMDQFIRAKAKTSDVPQAANSPSSESGPKIDRNPGRPFGRTIRSDKKQYARQVHA